MAVKIRLRAQGSVRRAVYRVVATDSRSPRDGKYLEALGWYNPLAQGELRVQMKPDRLQHWLDQGAEFSDKVESLMEEAAPGVFQNMRTKQQAQRVKSAKKRRGK
jgi:small subunit ribosomal protein S16